MLARPIVLLLTVLLLATAIGCVSGISSGSRAMVDYQGPFHLVQSDPHRYQDRVAMLGGRIIATDTNPDGSTITVLQLPLDSNDRPKDSDGSKGRFLIRTPSFLDPAEYSKNALLTVVGRLSGSESRMIGQMPYNYPLVSPIEIKLWPKARTDQPRVQFGFGVGTSF